MPQFQKQTSRPLTTAGYRARTRRMRALCDLIDKHAEGGAQLTRAINGLAQAASDLARRQRGQSIADMLAE